MTSGDLREARRRVRDRADELRHGLWVRVGPQTWRRVGSGLMPAHAAATKGQRRASAVSRALDVRFAFTVPRGRGTADVAIAAHDGGTVLLDLEGGRVIRRYGFGAVTEEYVSWRTTFTDNVSAPRFDVSGDRRVVTEELITGQHLLDATPPVRLDAVRQLIRDYASLTVAAGEHRAGLQAALDARMRAGTDGDLMRVLWEGSDLRWLRDGEVWVPSAYEATAKNLMIAPDGRPVPIDLGDLQPQPFFAYPLGIVTAAGSEVVDAYVTGALDGELAELWAAAGVVWNRDPRSRVAALLVRAAFAARRDEEMAVPGGFDASLAGRWASLKLWGTAALDDEGNSSGPGTMPVA